MGANQVMELEASNRQHRLMIELRVIEAVEEMNPTRTGSCEANSEPAGKLGVGTCHECGCLFVTYLDKTDLVLTLAQRFYYSVDSVSGQAKNDLNTPVDQP